MNSISIKIENGQLITSENESTGYKSTGFRSTGNHAAGNRSTGDCSSGPGSTGDSSTGVRSTGRNSTGDGSTGCHSTGECSTGLGSTGCRSTGHYSTGSYSTGHWSINQRSTGNFSVKFCPYEMFDKPCTKEEFCCAKPDWLKFEVTKWIYADDMTEAEKDDFLDHETTRGYLKVIPYREAARESWDKASKEEKIATRKLPNFDDEIFQQIFGFSALDENNK